MKSLERKFLNQSLKKCTTDVERVSIYYELASRFYDEARYKDAVSMYTAALELERNPNDKAYFLTQMGTSHYHLKHDQEAVSFLSRAKRAFKPNSDDFNPEIYALTYYYLGAIYAFQGKLKRSLREQLKALLYIDNLHRENRWLLLTGISRNFEGLGQTEQAIQYNQQALQVISDDDPNMSYLYESMGNNHFELGQYDEALKSYQRILELDANFERREEIYSRIGQCYKLLTNYRSALDAYRTILEVKQLTGSRQSLAEIYREIANCLFRLGEFSSALETARKGLKSRTRDKQLQAQLYSLVAVSHYELGSQEQAVRAGDKSLDASIHFSGMDQLLFRMAMAHHKLGNSKEFGRFRKWCHQSFPDHAWNKLLEKLA